MTRHLAFFIALGLFWGLSQPLYRAMADRNVPPSHVIFYTGIMVGLGLMAFARVQGKRIHITRQVSIFGLVCAILMNIPFGLGLFLIRHVPPTDMALIVSTAPLFNYVLALVLGEQQPVPRKVLALAAGFAASAVIILGREGSLSGNLNWWTLVAFITPTLYAVYNWYASHHWPVRADVYSIGTAESFWSSVVVLPLFLTIDAPWHVTTPVMFAYWTVIAAGILWIVERIAFFTLIRDKGAVYTIQAVYLSTPSAVLFGILFYGGGTDVYLWVALALVMLALWLNNSGSSIKSADATQPSA